MRQSPTLGIVSRVVAGNCLEVYDLIVFGYYATEIGRTFFPTQSFYISLLLSFATFGAGYLMRPVGAIILGTYIDSAGRRAGLILTLTLMCIGTATIAATPSYSRIGLLAPVIVVTGRLIQGFSAGAEQGGVSVYLSEIATPGRGGFCVSFQSASTQLSVVMAAGISLLVAQNYDATQISAWAWRIPFFIGCLLIPLLFVLRRSLQETESFRARHRLPYRDVLFALIGNRAMVPLASSVAVMTTVSFYILNAYTPTFGKVVLNLKPAQSLGVTLIIGIANLLWLPLGGLLSDRVGRFPVIAATTITAVVTAYPVMRWMVSAPSFDRLLMASLWLSVLYGFFNGAMIIFLIECMPEQIRTVGFSLSYSLATVVGGFAPVVVTWLIHRTGDRAISGACLSVAAFVSLLAAFGLVQKKTALRTDA